MLAMQIVVIVRQSGNAKLDPGLLDIRGVTHVCHNRFQSLQVEAESTAMEVAQNRQLCD
jgi:hypothetical protein